MHFISIVTYRLFVLFLFLIIVPSGYAQTKYEKEVRIKETSVPATAITYIESFNFNKKVRWYQEFGIDRTSFEAKTKFHGKKYSIEFNTAGVLEDVEIEMQWNELPQEAQKTIEKFLRTTYAKYTIDKIQIQYTGPPNKIATYILEGGSNQELTIHYEIVINTKLDRKFKQLELLFSSEGVLLKSAEVVSKSAVNIEY